MLLEEKEIKAFVFGIRFAGYFDSKLQYKVQIIDEGVPREVIMLQLKSILRNFEREYYNKEK